MEAIASSDPEYLARVALEGGRKDNTLAILRAAYGRSIYGYCQRRLKDATLADDVHQTVFLQAFQDLPRFAGRATFRCWLFSIARYRCMDALKAGRNWSKHFSMMEELPESPDPRPNADERLSTAATHEVLYGCLQRLGPSMRQAVVLRHLDQLSYNEMEGRCQERAPTLRVRVARAMPRLRRDLRARGVGG